MAFTDTKTFLSDLINQGSDALSNLYYLEFVCPSIITGNTPSLLKVRAGDFKPPAFNQTTDKKNYMTVSVDLPKPEIQGDKKFSITFRVDENWDIYKKLIELKQRTSKPNVGFINPNVNDYANDLTIKVFAYDSSVPSTNSSTGIYHDYNKFKELWVFKYCWITALTGLDFTYDSSNALKVTAEISFQDFEDPETKLGTPTSYPNA